MDDRKKSRTARRSGKTADSKRSSRMTKLVLRSIVLVCGVAIVTFAITKAARPYLLDFGEKREITEVKSQIATAKAQKKALEEQIAYLATPAGREAEARKHGWAKPGEIAIVIGEDKDSSEGGHEPGETGSHEPLWQKAGRHVLSVFVRER